MMSNITGVSIIVPVLNEAENISNLVARVVGTFAKSPYDYEIIFVDDNSTDDTKERIVLEQMKNLGISYRVKRGQGGKAFSVMEGATYAHFETVCMIDADLQYAPEAIVPMLDQMNARHNDVVVSNRTSHSTPFIRQLTSNTFHLVFTRMLFGIEYDTQSGLKIFKRNVLSTINISPSPWSFDLQFIVISILKGFSMSSYDIEFSERTSGKAKVNLILTSLELARESLKLRARISGRELRKLYKKNNELAV